MHSYMIMQRGRSLASMRQRTGSPIPRHRENAPSQDAVPSILGEDLAVSEAFHGWLKTWAWTLAGLFVYVAARWVVDACIPADPVASAELFKQVPLLVYQMSSTAFFTALVLNLTSLLFEDNAPKRQLALLSCAIKGAACHTDMLLITGQARVVYDAFGAIVIPQRYVQWLVTTPTMVYILSKISDFTPMQTATAICMDVVMVLSGLIANFARGPYLNWLMFCVSMLSFIGVLYMMGLMVYSAVKEHTSHTSRRSLLFIYMCTLLIWTLFPVAWMLHVLKSATPYGEYLNVFANFMAKVLFSSSIMYGNCMTIAQRRLLSQRAAENAHRVRMIQELRDAVTRKDQFMSLMSHELRTPLNGIIQLSDALVRGAGGDMNPKGQHFVKTIKNSSNHLLNIINDILDVAALKEGKLTIKHELCSTAKAVDHVVDIVAPLARKDVVIERFVDPRTPLIIADFSRVIQILYNLAGNALKFTHRGRVCVRVAPTADGSAVTLQVADTGIGIPADRINGIWGAFEQVDMSVTRKYGGTGLGLNIVKQLVEAHEGQIEVHSAEGRGTTFVVTLPVLQPSTRQSLEAQVNESLMKCGHTAAPAVCKRRTQRLVSSTGRNPSFEETISQLGRGVTCRASGLMSPQRDVADGAGHVGGSNHLEREDVLYRRRTQELERENLIGELQRRTEHKRSMEEAQFASRQLELSEPERQAERDSRSLECLDLQIVARTKPTAGAGAARTQSAVAPTGTGGGSYNSAGLPVAVAAYPGMSRGSNGGGGTRQCSETGAMVPRSLGGSGSTGSFQAWRGDAEVACRAITGRRSLTAAADGEGSGGSTAVSTAGTSLADVYEHVLIARSSVESHSSSYALIRNLSGTSIGGVAKSNTVREALRMSTYGTYGTYGRAPGSAGGGNGMANSTSGPVPATSSHLLMKALDSDLYRTGRDSYDDASSLGADSESEGPRNGWRHQRGSGHLPRTSKLIPKSASLSGNNTAAASVVAPPPGLTLDKLAYSDMYGTVQILSVDDEEVNQIVLEEILTSTGYRFARCMDGVEALEWLCASDTMPDLILLDCMMPNMSGHEFCATLRKVIPGNVLPVIMVSAKSDEDNIVEGLRSGSNDFVRKPYQREELLARIETQLRLKSDSWWLAELVNNVDGRETESMKLLKNILPESIIARMQQGQKFVADSHAHVVILFSDIVGFTSLSSKLPTAEVFLMLSNMFTSFDKLTDRFCVYKVETIGDAYMVAAGHDEDQDKARKGTPLMRVLGFARAMLDVVRNITAPNGERMRIRIGVHCGPAFAGVIGMKCPRYCFLGDTVNTASRMESTGFPMCIHVSEDVYLHHPNPDLELVEVGEREVKGKGRMRTYLVRVGSWEQALRDLTTRQQAAAAISQLQQQQQQQHQELLALANAGVQQQQSTGEHGASELIGSCAACGAEGFRTTALQGSDFTGSQVQLLPLLTSAHGPSAPGVSRSTGQLPLSMSPATSDGINNGRFMHLLSTVTEETSLPPSPLTATGTVTQPTAQQCRPFSLSEQHTPAVAIASAGGGSVGGLMRLSSGSTTGIRSPLSRPELSATRLLPRSTFGSEAYYYDELSEDGATSTLNGMVPCSSILRSCSGSLTGFPSTPHSVNNNNNNNNNNGGRRVLSSVPDRGAATADDGSSQRPESNVLLDAAAKLGLHMAVAATAAVTSAAAGAASQQEQMHEALGRAGLVSAAEGAAASAAALERKFAAQLLSGGLRGAGLNGGVPSTMVTYLEQRIASLAEQLAAETLKRHKLQADLDKECRRATAALQQITFLQQAVAAAAFAACNTRQSAAGEGLTGALTASSPPLPQSPHRRHPLGGANLGNGDGANPMMHHQQLLQQRHNPTFLQEQQHHVQEQVGEAGSNSASSDGPDAEVVILGPVDDDAETGSGPETETRGPVMDVGAASLPEPPPILSPTGLPLNLPLAMGGSSRQAARYGPRAPLGSGGGSVNSGMPASPFVLTDIEWHSAVLAELDDDAGMEPGFQRRELQGINGAADHQVPAVGDAAAVIGAANAAATEPDVLRPKLSGVNAAAGAAKWKLSYGRGGIAVTTVPFGLFSLEFNAPSAVTDGGAYAGNCSALQPGWLLPRYSLDLLFEELGLLPYLGKFQEEAVRLDQLLGMDVGQMERLGLRPLGYCLRLHEAVLGLARGLLRACEEAALLAQPPPNSPAATGLHDTAAADAAGTADGAATRS